MKILRCWCSNPTGWKLFAINLLFTTKQYKVDNIVNFVYYGKTRIHFILFFSFILSICPMRIIWLICAMHSLWSIDPFPHMSSASYSLHALFLPSATKLRRLCFYRRLSVHKVGGGVCLSACWDTTPQKQTPPKKQTPPQEQTPPRAAEQTPPKSRHPPEADTPPKSRHPPKEADTPPPEIRPLLRTVRILLECILECAGFRHLSWLARITVSVRSWQAMQLERVHRAHSVSPIYIKVRSFLHHSLTIWIQAKRWLLRGTDQTDN